ncbi:MAG: hypothetical protein KC996_01565 [Phycisphaerales bacterium]|nr:hypothetical protein [Phycisphaerales bacterium]
MRKQAYMFAGTLASIAGLAVAQPTVDGIYDAGTEGSLYSNVIWTQTVPTGFGDNSAGLFNGGNFGNPADVTTGVEIAIPLASLGLSGGETIRIAGWVNSGDRTFKSNQIVGALPLDTGNLGGAQDLNAAPFDLTTQHISVDLSGIASSSATVDGSLGADSWSQVFVQGNYTGFGNETDGTVDGSGPNGGGSEIDAIYMAKDGTNLYIFVAGNLETNGNGLDLYIDTGAGGLSTLASGSGDGGFIPGGQAGLVFDAGFDADYVLSVDTWDDDADGLTINVPRMFFGPISGSIDDMGSLAGYGSAGALAGGISMAIDNSNIEGVIGDLSQATPVSPDADWAYGTELDNARVYIDTANNKLYLFLGGNLEVNYNKLNLFFDVQPGGQNVLRDDNVDISFNGLNSMSNIVFDTGFEPDYWMNINTGVDGGSGNVVFYADAATLRTNGPNTDPFFGAIQDYGAYAGGDIATHQLLDFSGPRIDIQDGSLGSIFTEYAPRLTAVNPLSPVPGLILVANDNSNVAGVTDSSAAGAAAVTTGIELCFDLDELGWDGSQDILVAGWISNAGFDYISNQVLGGIPGPDNIGPRDSDGDGTNDLDFNAIAGDQFINLSNPAAPDCAADFTDDGILDIFDVFAFLDAFNAMDPSADFTDDGTFDIFDVFAFLDAFNAGCP